ncbi:hypothetical protein EMIHUDRAFT_431863 [Emiliania huxleyi CCMP1516]|uniref:CWF21 domain-containing protein n=2 Tax=Emiliania huxleyi TaxID=2903 RepID=A0A0D3L1M5_EMIH1|nr:hypothetical protein EMIHUDRAFT_431863 [Emiliania huxleyi CCMP1516]EOD41910.1 hypothetical protein EMIHUDRAFT_431863 [Emiliania huxleyi CCMP1516]|eukprot:XP_005794339.1 hypothetical protein EMIHUDRAFT_431863 [Emiliania huxleyi CCMP1516]
MNPDRSCDTRDSPRNSRGSGSGSGSRSRSRSRSGSRSFSRSRSPPHPADDEGVSEFERASAFAGARRGMVFKLGASGLGYYADHGSEAAAAEAEAGAMRAALREVKEGDAGATAPADDPDAPIVAALASHRRGLAEAEAATEALLREAGRSGGRHLSHEAQKVEVRLTDQLLQLTEMRDDCETAAGRAVVKAEMERLQRLGRSLRSLSGGQAERHRQQW